MHNQFTKYRCTRLSLVALALVWVNSPVQSDTKPPIEEVFQAELVYPQEQGEVQVTILPRFSRSESQNIALVPFSLEYGITDSWQFEFEWNSLVAIDDTQSKTKHGIGDLSFGTKYSFLNISQTGFNCALTTEIELPVGDENEGFGSGETTFGGSVILAQDFRKSNAQLFAQVGTEIENSEMEPFWNTGFFLPVTYLVVTGEYSWTETASYLAPGLVFALPENLQIGIGVPIGLTEDSDHYQVIGLLTYEFTLRSDSDED